MHYTVSLPPQPCFPRSGCRSRQATADEPTDTIYAGDTVTVVKDQVELGLRDKPSTVLNTGDTVRVTEVRGSWIGGYAMKDGQRYTGWVHRDEVKLVVIPADKVAQDRSAGRAG